jgi:DNA-binding NarL/FixJ family response regulator
MARVSVLIADDHPHVIEHLCRLLKDEYEVVGIVSDGERLVAEATRLRPDVVLTDISMPGLSGLEALRRLKAVAPDVRVIVLTMHVDAAIASEAIRSGAAGFVVKLLAGEQLSTAIDEVMQGRLYVTPGVHIDFHEPV